MLKNCEYVEIIIHMKDGTKLPMKVTKLKTLRAECELNEPVENFETGYLRHEPTGYETWTIFGLVEKL